jgi:D-alanyl-lipoteichoic acid acyltransferase DltB (MBOAT superfamily)
MAWRPIYLFLILGLTIANYWLGLKIWHSVSRKKAWLIAAITINIGTLAYFKYFYFLEDMFSALTRPWFGDLSRLPINIILPLGISFFVFEFVHYLVEVYRGHEPVREFLTFALFPSFFPTQIAGPIKRFQSFVPQLKEPPRFSLSAFDEGAFLVLSGLFKKVLLADNLALFVAGGFSNPERFTGLDLWLFAVAFDFQVYFDFGGYAEIARGSAKMLGYDVPINFNFPYLSKNIAEFWHRWHITLGTWLRDYLYIPLGGSRHGRLKACRNLIITMMLGGLWHGAEFHFVLWGLYQGLMLSVHREFRIWRESLGTKKLVFVSERHQGLIFSGFSMFLTFAVTTLGMAIFRAQDTASVFAIVKKMLFFGDTWQIQQISILKAINYPLIYPSIFILLPLFFIGQVIAYRIQKTDWLSASPRIMKAAYAAGIILLLLAYAPDTSPRFIYYQF